MSALIDVLMSPEVRLAVAVWLLCSPAVAILAAQYIRKDLE